MKIKTKAEEIVEILGLTPLGQEGGMFLKNYGGSRDARGCEIYSSIYYLLTRNSFSHMHMLKTDEIYHFYMGDSVELLLLYPDGRSEIKILGNDLAGGERPQILAPAGVWQGSRLVKGGEYSLLGTTMAPAYLEEEYIHGDCETLCRLYPDVSEKIRQRCGEVVDL